MVSDEPVVKGWPKATKVGRIAELKNKHPLPRASGAATGVRSGAIRYGSFGV